MFKPGDKVKCLTYISFTDNTEHKVDDILLVTERDEAYYNVMCENYELVVEELAIPVTRPKTIPLYKSQPFLTETSFERLDFSEMQMFKLYYASRDSLQRKLIEEICRLKGYSLETTSEPKYA